MLFMNPANETRVDLVRVILGFHNIKAIAFQFLAWGSTTAVNLLTDKYQEFRSSNVLAGSECHPCDGGKRSNAFF